MTTINIITITRCFIKVLQEVVVAESNHFKTWVLRYLSFNPLLQFYLQISSLSFLLAPYFIPRDQVCNPPKLFSTSNSSSKQDRLDYCSNKECFIIITTNHSPLQSLR
jgi:hypothetical protein